MRLVVPDLEIGEQEGFSKALDIFNRKPFGEKLADIVEGCSDGAVLALDAPWGEGKTTFIKMWRGYIAHEREPRLEHVYFDAFANDYQQDPFFAVASELYDLIRSGNDEAKATFIRKTGNVVKSLVRGSIRIGVNTAAAGLLSGSVLDSVQKEVSDLVSGQVDTLVADRLKSTETDRLALAEFRDYLAEFVSSQGNGRPVVFLVDELDRCRPDFALELLEKIKHLFSVRGLVFLLVLNRAQLEATVNARYGSGVVAARYLHKFVHLWLQLPSRSNPDSRQRVKYLDHVILALLDNGERYNNQYSVQVLEEVAESHRLSCRDIDRIAGYLALVQRSSGREHFSDFYQFIVAYGCFLKVVYPDLLHDLTWKSMGMQEILERSGLGGDQGHLIEVLIKVIEYSISDEGRRAQMTREDDTVGALTAGIRHCGNVLQEVAQWLSGVSYA